jgi:hypothetical protein
MATYEDYANNGSLLFGDMGTALMIMRLEPTSTLADLIHTRANGNTRLPIRELMWGTPGSMIACHSMSEMTGEARWKEIFESQAERLLADLQESPDGPIWEQDLYDRRLKYLGSAWIRRQHGPAFARMGLANGKPARSRNRRCPAHSHQERLADRCRCFMASSRCSRQTAVALPILSRGSRHGRDVF